jgi:amidophosphoribosyltransferase
VCGILGIFGKIELRKAQKMLNLLTHRGQNASGIAWISEDNKIKIEKEKGYLNPLKLPTKDVELLIGSTRYPTYGMRISDESSIEKYAQPFVYPVKDEQKIATTHNGQLVNIKNLSKDEIYHSDSDLICKLLAEILQQKKDFTTAVKQLMEILDGAYSEICITNTIEPSMLVFRDPLGMRPLILGRLGNTYIFSSESVVIEQFGGEIIRDVEPGELIVLQKKEKTISIQSYQLKKQKPAHCIFEYVYFASPASIIDNRSVYNVRAKLGEFLAEEIKKHGIEIDYVVPVPDSSRIAGQKIAETLSIPLKEAILKNRYHTSRTFILNSMQARNSALESKYIYVKHLIEDKIILVVDDSIVRGKTAIKIIEKLRLFGAKKIIFASTCPPLIRPCYYGIDMALDSEFCARNRSLSELSEFLGADLVIYQGLGDLFKAINLNNKLCTACITGEYPTKAGKNIRQLLKEGKIDPNIPHYEQEQLLSVRK